MYFRMLKKDLFDKVGLNITLFIFMILASVFMVVSTQLLFTSFVKSEKTYEICNTADILMVMETSVSDSQGRHHRVEAFFEKISGYDRAYLNERMIYPTTMIKYIKDEGSKDLMVNSEIMFATVQTDHNIPYDLEDKPLKIPNGCVALPQNLLNNTEARVGDTIHITTQMGNIYEFTVSAFYKDPSAYIYDRFLFSDADYAVLSAESPVKRDVYEIYLANVNDNYVDVLMDIGNRLIVELEDLRAGYWSVKTLFSTNDGIIGLIVSLVLSVIGIFMIAMIFMTIHFSLKSAIKREEKEIGIMKAIGVYSFSYRTLFAVKYIAFAIAGGIIGIPVAMPLGKMLMQRFMIHIILPTLSERILISLMAVLFMMSVVITFVFFSLRHMNKISVMNAIHGENRGERFRKIPGLFLHKTKRINIPLFMAISDILGRIKRYGYLILAYVFGICMIFLAIQIKDSVCGIEYAKKYLRINAMDFSMEINESYFSRCYERTGSAEAVYEEINETLKENGVPAKAEFFSYQTVNAQFGEKELLCSMFFGTPDPAEVAYIEGGVPPTLSNEMAMAYLSAKQSGIELGDIVTVEYDKYREDYISYGKVKEEFVVTAFFDGQCWGVTPIIMGKEFSDAVSTGNELFQYRMDCPESQYQEYYDKMDELFTDEEIRFKPKGDAMIEYLVGFDTVFNFLLTIVSVVVAGILIMITVLYENIFIAEEISDVAVLKSMGFDQKPIKWWQMIRILLLVGLSYLTAVIFTTTIGRVIIGQLVNRIIYVYDFQLVIRFFANFVVVPVCVILLVALCLLPVLKAVNKIEIWRIRDE